MTRSFKFLVHPARLELATLWFEAKYSIRLSYGCEINTKFKARNAKSNKNKLP